MRTPFELRRTAIELRGLSLVVLCLGLGVVMPATTRATTFFEDDFSGSSLDADEWELGEQWQAPTQMRDDKHAGAIIMTGDTVLLPLETFNPTAQTPGDSLYGTDIRTRTSFEVGNGLCIESRMRLAQPIVRGYLAAGLLVEDTVATVWDGVDAADLLSNDADDVANGDDSHRRVATNVRDDYPSTPAEPQFVPLPVGQRSTEFGTYGVCVGPHVVTWYVVTDGAGRHVLRRESSVVPNARMKWHFNIRVPETDFVQAYDPSMQPVASADENRIFYLEVDRVVITTPEPSAELLCMAGIMTLGLLACAHRSARWS